MDVRAPYSEDGEYYEAIIKEIYDKDHVLVLFYGNYII